MAWQPLPKILLIVLKLHHNQAMLIKMSKTKKNNSCNTNLVIVAKLLLRESQLKFVSQLGGQDQLRENGIKKLFRSEPN